MDAKEMLTKAFNQVQTQMFIEIGLILKEYLDAEKIPKEKIDAYIKHNVHRDTEATILQSGEFVRKRKGDKIVKYRVYQILDKDQNIQIGYQYAKGDSEYEPIGKEDSVGRKPTANKDSNK